MRGGHHSLLLLLLLLVGAGGRWAGGGALAGGVVTPHGPLHCGHHRWLLLPHGVGGRGHLSRVGAVVAPQ